MFILILASLFVAVIFLAAFLWAVRSGQFDDRYTPSIRFLLDDRKHSIANYEDKQKRNEMREN
jgi:cbb3-type cytochrome oxidase maturation protein